MHGDLGWEKIDFDILTHYNTISREALFLFTVSKVEVGFSLSPPPPLPFFLVRIW